MNASAAADQAVPPRDPPRDAPRDPWRRRLVNTLLYGRNVDRTVKARARIGLAILIFVIGYSIIATRLVLFAALPDSHLARRAMGPDAVATARPDVLDRNGEILATDVRTPSLFAEPHRIIDVDEASEFLTAVMIDSDAKEMRDRLASKRRFVWLKREITPKQREQIHRLGLPGIGFLPENKRIYPNGSEVSHIIGHVNIDNQGIAGIEKWLDTRGLADLHLAGLATDRLQKPIELAVDLRVQHAMRDELIAARSQFKAIAAAAVLTDVRTGEVISMVSVPDYDSNNPREALDPTRINRLTTGVYEMGSTFKALTLAMALDSGKILAQVVLRRARRIDLRQVHDPRLPRAEPRADRAGDFHLFIQCRDRAHGAQPWHRAPQVVSQEDGAARPAAHGTARERRAARAQAMG